ncbi:hypothetical protein [Terrarubrum flagellatum]|uniref:hypothetical protein n=1 Tax=Terrirubrum flagellatum TaxID=2895980 RepID=UPI00314540E3
MGANGWRAAIVLIALPASLFAAMLTDFALVGGVLLFGVFLVGCWIAERIFRRLATPEDVRRDLEDRVRNPPS